MKLLMQDFAGGGPAVVEAPAPRPAPGTVLIEARLSLISTGTERMLVAFGKANFFEKARSQPDKVKAVVEKARTDGVLDTVDAVRDKLREPIPLGYAQMGVARAVGEGVDGIAPGDRVIAAAPHGDLARAPKHLCARIPDRVVDEDAVFAVPAAIALQGVRLAEPTLGESVAVFGAGLIGLLSAQLLIAQGCRVLALDFDEDKLALAAAFGAETFDLSKDADPIEAGLAFSRGRGVDAALIAASTKSSQPIDQAAKMARKRGRIVLTGVAGLALDRAAFYQKELGFRVSCSYGPGRYDPNYEERGEDYPIGFVRWTEQRNFEAALDLMAAGKLKGAPLISHRRAFEDAPAAYADLLEDKKAIAILLDYGRGGARAADVVTLGDPKPGDPKPGDPKPGGPETGVRTTKPAIGVIGAGNYAARVMIPALRATGVELRAIASSGGVSAAVVGARSGFYQATTDPSALIADPAIDAIAVATRHDSHARFAIQALQAQKSVFVEKPLALAEDDLDAIATARAESAGFFTVGFNRRFSPLVEKARALLATSAEPKAMILTMNAGAIPPDHWTQDPAIGGGRIVGEACHLIDLARCLAGAPIASIQALRIGGAAQRPLEDKAAISLGFDDGSIATIHYLANGASNFPKERIEIFQAGRILTIDNFKRLIGHGFRDFRAMRLWRKDKGHQACAHAFARACRTGGPPPIPEEELLETSRAAIRAAEQLRASS